MTATERADGYLTIPSAYGESLGGVRWSHGCDALELADGSTLALTEEVTAVLEGVFARPPVPPFAHVLHLLLLMKRGDGDEFGRLREVRTEARGRVAVHRNAGLLIAELCRGHLPTPAAPPWADVAAALSRLRLFGEHRRPDLAHEPLLGRAEFERRVRGWLVKFDDAALAHWLTHGCGPTDGRRLAEPAESLPARAARLLAHARRRPRLVGAAVLTPALDAGLTLPPRRREPDALPQGGYADVTTRGEPERLLLSQLALDPDEFVRRFAERELLYFRREEPRAAETPDRLIVLDQGVRTWGVVRHALAAAALSLLRKDPKKVGPARLVLTAAEGTLDPATADVDELADLLEASDLTPHPGVGLTRAVRGPADGLRDLILLTHPRNLREPDVAAAAKGRRPGDRLFALSVDDRGRAELTEWTDGGPVAVRSFRVDLAAAEAARVQPGTARPRAGGTWAGDVEPVGFPFRPGLVAEPTTLGFDADGEWLVAVSRDGVPHGLSFDGSAPEVLPRVFRDGAALKQVEAVLGVTDGVVVCGRMTFPGRTAFVTVMSLGQPVFVGGPASEPITYAAGPPTPPGVEVFVAAHYDRPARRLTLHVLGPAFRGARWAAYPDLQCVAVVPAGQPPPNSGHALDLATRGRFPGGSDTELVSRARVAWDRAVKSPSPPLNLPVESRMKAVAPGPGPYLHLAGNTVDVNRADPPWKRFEPQRDGLPMLAGSAVYRAHLAGDILALDVSRPGERKLVLFRGPDGSVLGELSDVTPAAPFALSADGRHLAYGRGRGELVVRDVGQRLPVAVATRGRLHDSLSVVLNDPPLHLVVRVRSFEHTFRVVGGRLAHAFRKGVDHREQWNPPADQLPTAYDPDRFRPRKVVGSGRWRAAVDRLGQVVLFTRDGVVVLSVLVRREKAAVWAAGEVFWGAAELIGGPPTPDAEGKIGRAVLAAGE